MGGLFVCLFDGFSGIGVVDWLPEEEESQKNGRFCKNKRYSNGILSLSNRPFACRLAPLWSLFYPTQVVSSSTIAIRRLVDVRSIYLLQ